MNMKQLIAAVAVFTAAGSAFAAGQTEFIDHTDFQSTKTRAQVRAELAQRSAPSAVVATREWVEHAPVVAATTTRAQVRAELDKAYAAGALSANKEWVEHTPIASTKTRDEVRNEVLQAKRNQKGASGS